MKYKQVYVLSYNAGVLGVFAKKYYAIQSKRDYDSYDYRGVKVEEFTIY